MALGSGIEWTESTWNPVTGCNKISPSSLTLRNSTRVSGPRNHDMAHRGCKSTGVPPA